MVPEARLESTEHGLVPDGDGWFVLNAREARWRPAKGRGAYCIFEGEPEFAQYGIHLVSLEPGDAMAMYHWEADQEDFLVVAGEALLIVEGEERPLRQWDFVHCPAGTKHVIVGAGAATCLVLAAGARDLLDRTGVGRLYGGRDGASSRRRRRARHDRPGRGVRGGRPARTEPLPRRLAARVGSGIHVISGKPLISRPGKVPTTAEPPATTMGA